mmetsp:Transcript_14971/g.38625  ORF Transcript_14971/g.38625 Transcript_14971/m.38625 type:complete len:123 (-) Transcript_14971:756-1124(-)
MLFSVFEQLVASTICTVVGLLIPAYQSFKVLKAKGDVKPLLAYWSCFAVFLQVTMVLEALYVHLLPLYYLAKVGALCYLVAPQVCLASLVICTHGLLSLATHTLSSIAALLCADWCGAQPLQ